MAKQQLVKNWLKNWRHASIQYDRRRHKLMQPCSIAPTRCYSAILIARHRPFPRNGIMPSDALDYCRLNKNIQNRSITLLPEIIQDFSLWGGTGYLIKSFHSDIGLPYWGTFSAMNFCLRASLLPVVIYGARTAANYAKVSPEIQFIVKLYQRDLKKMRSEGKSLLEKRNLLLQNIQTVRSIYKLHNINPLSVFLSPFLQIPCFYYVATDLRKMVNGSDPALAQELTESKFLWVTDLTDPDPWFGLPCAAGAMLYFNVEVAIGKKNLGGNQSDFARLLKDLFQTLAVFMPCFTSQSPAGLQIYLVSSFTWTLFQSAALRNDTMRGWMNLPAIGMAPSTAKYAEEFMKFKKLEQKARDIRGDGPILGRNILACGFETSFPGTNRPSTIQGSGYPPPDLVVDQSVLRSKPKFSVGEMEQKAREIRGGGEYVHGVSAPMYQLEEQLSDRLKEETVKNLVDASAQSDLKNLDEVSHKASDEKTDTFDPQKFKRRKQRVSKILAKKSKKIKR